MLEINGVKTLFRRPVLERNSAVTVLGNFRRSNRADHHRFFALIRTLGHFVRQLHRSNCSKVVSSKQAHVQLTAAQPTEQGSRSEKRTTVHSRLLFLSRAKLPGIIILHTHINIYVKRVVQSVCMCRYLYIYLRKVATSCMCLGGQKRPYEFPIYSQQQKRSFASLLVFLRDSKRTTAHVVLFLPLTLLLRGSCANRSFALLAFDANLTA